jgi:ubiquinol-cytochrome c reductase cytochrome b subunit
MFSSLLILLAMPLLHTSRIRSLQFSPIGQFFFWAFVANFGLLMFLGACHVEAPYIQVGQVATAFYFGWFLVIVPLVGLIDNTLADLATLPLHSQRNVSSRTL